MGHRTTFVNHDLAIRQTFRRTVVIHSHKLVDNGPLFWYSIGMDKQSIAVRDAQIVLMREQRYKFREIGERFGMTKQAAWKIWNKAMLTRKPLRKKGDSPA